MNNYLNQFCAECANAVESAREGDIETAAEFAQRAWDLTWDLESCEERGMELVGCIRAVLGV